MPILKSIYILEDSTELAEAIQDFLQAEGFSVIINNGFNISIEEIKSKKPDLLLVDWMLPAAEGVDIIKQIKDNPETKEFPCILMTGKTSEKDQITGYSTGVDAYVTKPFSFHVLLALIKNIELRSQLLNKPSRTADALASSDISQADQKFFNDYIEIVKKDFSNPALKLEHIASKLNCDKVTLINRIKFISTKTPYEIIKNHRLAIAKEQIETGRYNITEVAYKVGYQNLSVFSKAFKNTYGVSPRAYANSFRKQT